MANPAYILTVCTANICRSPMAEALLQHALRGQPAPLNALTVISAGVAAQSGDRVSENSVYALKKVGIDLSRHVARPLTEPLVREALAVFCMTEQHRAMIHAAIEPQPSHVYLFREFMPPPADPEIADPFGGSLKLYEACRDEMVEAIPSLIGFLKDLMASRTAAAP